MATEISAGRLVAPFYGTSTPVWALLIGSVLSSLTVGQIIGGHISKRSNSYKILSVFLIISGILLALLPVFSSPIMDGSISLFQNGKVGILLASGISITVLLSLPLIALGAAGPILIHHAVEDHNKTGQIAGRLYAFNTAGSLVGTYLAGIVLIAVVGTCKTLWICSGAMIIVGLFFLSSKWVKAITVILICIIISILIYYKTGHIKNNGKILYETETPYNYLQVVESGNLRRLLLNEGFAVQSLYFTDNRLPLFTVWGYYGLSPAWTKSGNPQNILLIGLGGGTGARTLKNLYPDAQITGVEIDPEVVEVGYRYFNMPKNINVVIDDGRAYLQRDSKLYDVIIVDAFKFPYVPFQLCTREFFIQLNRHLAEGGAVVLNIGRDKNSYDVVDSVARTLKSVFKNVRGADMPNDSNTILVGTNHNSDADAGINRLNISDEAAKRFQSLTPPQSWNISKNAPLLTDDKAPVELLTDTIVLRRLWRGANL